MSYLRRPDRRLWAAALAIVMASVPVMAGTASKSSSSSQGLLGPVNAENFRPNGPVTVTADRAELENGHAVLYTGHVTLVSDTIKMQGDHLELHQLPGGHYQARITGAPAHLEHAGAGPDNPPVTAHANTLVYDSRSTEIELLGDAQFTRADNQINADTIRYNVADRRAQAEGGSHQAVMVFTPPPPGASTAAPGAHK
jgi:lipopolysaccharide transport protein LptA